MGFTINIAKGFKKNKIKRPNRVSRLCLGTVIKEENEYKIQISLRNDPEFPDYITIPFTEKSLNLKGKLNVYKLTKNKYGHYPLYHRDIIHANLFPGLDTQYSVVVEKVICSGFVIRKDGKLYFDLKETHGIGTKAENIYVKIDESKPLFPSKDNEYNSN